VFVTHHSPVAVLARYLATREIKGITIAESRRVSEFAHRTGLLDPSQLSIIRDVAKYQVPPNRRPGGSFTPQGARIQALNRCIPEPVPGKPGVEHHNIRIRVSHRFRPIARRQATGKRNHGSHPDSFVNKFPSPHAPASTLSAAAQLHRRFRKNLPM
jgi:hypothetical protein